MQKKTCVPAKAPRKRKPVNRKRELEKLILTLLTPSKIWKLRDRYALGNETIGQLAKLSWCPPVLLYCILTPLWSKTSYKLRQLRLEKNAKALFNQGVSVRRIAAILKVPVSIAREHTTDQFSDATYRERPWYHQRAPKPKPDNELRYDVKTLPPIARLKTSEDTLADILPERIGLCPTCGKSVYLPCLACRVRADMAAGRIPPPGDYADDFEEEDEEHEPDLLFH